MKSHLYVLVSGLCYSLTAPAALANSETQFSVKAAHYDREFSNQNNTRTQTGVGLILRHQQSFLNKLIELKGAAYSAIKLASSGQVRQDLLTIRNGDTSGFSLLGEASIQLNLSPNLSVEYGRLRHDSMLLESKTRLLPSSFQGFNINWAASKNHRVYVNRYTKWSERANPNFNDFNTGVDSDSVINAILIAGTESKFQISDSQTAELNIEVLESKNYLRKVGVVGQLKHSINDKSSIKLKGSLQSSRDAGNLFVVGANSTLDSVEQNLDTQLSNSQIPNPKLKHDGIGAYLSAEYKFKQSSITLGITKIGDAWLEDNFDNDHGTTPFPTRTFGPDLTNTNETVWLGEYQYQWKRGILKGLSSKFSIAKGMDIENSIDSALGRAEEQWWSAEARYKRKFTNKLLGFDKSAFIDARFRYRSYQSNEIGEVAGIASDRNEWRAELSYSIEF